MLFGKRKRVVNRILIVEDEPLTAFDNEMMLGDAWTSESSRGDFGEDWPGYRWQMTQADWNSGAMTELTLEAPAGLIRVRAECRDGKVTQVAFRNVPAFAVHLDASIDVPTLGRVVVDVACGGMFYVIADAAPFGLRLTPDEGRDITRIGELIKAATQEQLPVVHPENPEIHDVTIAQLSGPPASLDNHRRNAVIVSTGKLDWERPATWTGAIDRSPCGTGTCAKMATLHARGRLGIGEPFRHEGILGTVFTGRLLEETTLGPYRAVVPELAGTAWITGFAQYVVDPQDPFPEGFTVGDIW